MKRAVGDTVTIRWYGFDVPTPGTTLKTTTGRMYLVTQSLTTLRAGMRRSAKVVCIVMPKNFNPPTPARPMRWLKRKPKQR